MPAPDDTPLGEIDSLIFVHTGSRRYSSTLQERHKTNDQQRTKGVAMSAVQPNEYTLQGGNLTFTYLKHNFLGQPYVSYTENGQTKNFSGSAVRILETGIGTLVTVTTHMSIDTGGNDFSVLLPVIELPAIGKSQAFSTDGIETHFKGPDSYPATGVRETYNFIPMTGVARFIVTVFQPVAVTAKAS
jgi:hypothetical protein